MSFLKFYLILTVLGILIDVLGLILSSNPDATEQVIFCFITSVLLLIIGIRGLVNIFKDYS
jgi:hypothetical protein